MKLSEAKVAKIRSRYATGKITQKELAAQYGITGSTVSRIVIGTMWALPPKKPSVSVVQIPGARKAA